MGFCVAAIVNEPAAVLNRFVGWYLAQGAEAITLYFDDPTHPDLTRLAELPRVICVACTAEFWQGLGVSAEARFTRRQNTVLTHAYHQQAEGWLLNVDADELMYAKGTTLAAWLENREDTQTIRIATAEHVHGGTGRLFRLPIPRKTVNAIYGAEADLFRRRHGLIGHADGKSFHRAGRADLRLRQHWSEDAAGQEVEGARLGAADGVYLLHYMAPDFTAWRAKLEWRLGSHGFPEPIKDRLRAIQAADGDVEAGYLVLFQLLHCIEPEVARDLAAVGGLLEVPSGFAR